MVLIQSGIPIHEVKNPRDSTDAAAIKQAQQLLNNKDFELELFAVHGYKYLSDVIQSLEGESMEKEKQ
ncbi:hypothetical protein ANN_15217 [Periplaneta americana]|uniref:Uncharacterized protein n=1 Tax=Periplaneta americana TaxID=6978 RepID=A0ABQ8SHL7_PERAM|nr:hypothetical protein ANN_15217 [Periplaneta americana]